MPPIPVVTACISAVLLAIIVKIAPGESEWKHEPLSESKEDLIRFVGGDGSTKLAGKLFLPTAGAPSPPIIVLAHGLGLSQDCSLDTFVKTFTAAGFAAFTFDYASFGASEGSPRHQVKPKRHVADLHAALAMIQKDANTLGVDATRLGLWGTSFGGGHVLIAASSSTNDSSSPSIKAVVSQVPALKSGAESVLGTLMNDPIATSGALAKTLAALAKWGVRAMLGQGATYAPLHGQPGSAATMQNPGDDEGYASLIPKGGGLYGWRNALTVGSVIQVLLYRPLNYVSKVQTPTLLISAETDTLCPAKNVERASKLMKNAELLIVKNAGHFDVYSGQELQTILESTVKFFQKHV